MNADSGQMKAITEEVGDLGDDVAGLDRHVSELTSHMAEILEAVIPILREAVTRERQHNARTASIRHTGRHRRDRQPPRCEGDGQ
jgi:hypothetical protein